MTDTKTCRTCGKAKPITTFNITRPSTANRRSECRACAKTKKRRRQGVLSLEALRARQSESAKTKRATQRVRQAARSERTAHIRRCVDQLLADDPRSARLAPATLRYRALYRYDPEYRAKEIERRELRKTPAYNDGSLTPRIIQRLFAATTRCPYCKQPMTPRQKSLDHVVPRSKGGTHSLLNVIVCCIPCNTRKARAMPDQLTLSA